MEERTEVILITGFLGSGKTTFLNRLLDAVPPGCKVLVMVNEFGEIGLDGALVNVGGYEVLEVSKGSIFCICVKRDFIQALFKIACVVKPDLLLMEATGVANPADLKMDLKLPLFQKRFHLAEQVCVIDVSSFDEAFKVFASVEKQISTSSLFLLNKVDMVSRDQVERIKQLIRAHHPAPRFVETTFCQMPVEELLADCHLPARGEQAEGSAATGQLLLPEELDAIISGMSANPFRDLTPPDRLVSAAYAWSGGLGEFRKLAQELPRGVVRGKGFLLDGDKPSLLNIVMGEAVFQDVAVDVPLGLLGKVVLIFPPELKPTLEKLVSRWSPRLKHLSTTPEPRA
jgi:G3E family GTPase